MPRRSTAPVSLTGGQGFSFEDEIAALFMVHLLTGRRPLEADFGKVIRIDFQVRESGWLLDDLLVTEPRRGVTPTLLTMAGQTDWLQRR
jgi:hypothetical protein